MTQSRWRMSEALPRLGLLRPSLRARIFVLLAGLTLCACAGSAATYWLAKHYLDATDILRQVNLKQQSAALAVSGEMWALEADALAGREADYAERRATLSRLMLKVRAGEHLEAGRELLARMDAEVSAQAQALDQAQALAKARVDAARAEADYRLAAKHREAGQTLALSLFALHGRDADLGVSSMRALARAATWGSMLAIPAGAVLGLLLGWVLLRQVLEPIRSVVLGAALEGTLKDELGGGLSGGPDEVRAVGELVEGLMRDVGQAQALLKTSQEHLIQTEKLALVGKLAAGVAHSVRNPLTSVKMRLFSLERALDLAPAQREDFDVISEEIRHLDTIVRNFLEFSRPPKPQFQHLSPSEVVDMTLVLLRHRLESYSVDVRIVREQPLPEVDVDPEQLKEVLVNLILNACDAMGENGAITIDEDTGFMDPLGRVAILQVSDSGPGIPKNVAERIFQPFFSTKEEGTGLGLAIAKRIMEEHGGYIHLKPSEGHGACFVLVLPLREKKAWLRS